TCRARGTRLVGKAFLAKIAERGWKPKAVGGLVLGADPIVMAIARESLDVGLEINAFLVRKEAKGHGTKKHIEGVTEMAGLDVVIIDDVCTTGDSTVAAVKHSRDAGMNVLGAICLVDRLMGARENLEVGLSCPFDAVFTLPELT
ncbi:MAG: phosphoribosyltransferase family protein, partial [Bryobacteraceae bacterium]